MNASTGASLERLQRDMRLLKAYALVLTVALLALGLVAVRSPSSQSVLDVERINIVDPTGVTRVVIANAERFPLPKLDGREYPRAVQPAGLVFYDAKGDELGGIAITDAEMGKISALAFDYPNYDAMGMVTRVSADGSDAMAGFLINSRPPAGLDVIEASRVVERRIGIHNRNEDAEIVLADPQGRDRIRLVADAAGDARIEVLDAEGNVTFRAPGAAKD
ncbi:hypothetical protein LDO26_14150 [Luteimonas sp. BDR2-5]|uniref:hypothetical protein n=1 Tax=Proluteimonas luteida TaxID=2878685 RepID=UPI001E5C0718|nr:hypothetical protein [Luteimonas sp. BDR2-5]MCD9029339.1 hypothetical protein [Luteimonas sp. BDR2-5]